MPQPIVLIQSSLLALLMLGATLLPVRAEQPGANPHQTWQMLDYIAVDYAGAVQGGHIVSPGEYAEMQEFAGAVRTQLASLPESSKQPALLARQLVAWVEGDRTTTLAVHIQQGFQAGVVEAVQSAFEDREPVPIVE